MTKKPDFSVSKIGFNSFAEKLNGRIAMIAFVLIYAIEYFFNIKITSYLNAL